MTTLFLVSPYLIVCQLSCVGYYGQRIYEVTYGYLRVYDVIALCSSKSAFRVQVPVRICELHAEVSTNIRPVLQE
jgi:hypothetical protein